MIGYLDLAAGLSGDMFLGCLVDAGWSVDELRDVVRSLELPVEEWSIEAGPVLKNSVAATKVTVDAREGHVHRGLGDIVGIVDRAALAPPIRERAVAVFECLAEAEAAVHGIAVDAVHFHEVGAVDAIVDVVGVVAGLDALGIERLHASPVPLGQGFVESAHGRLALPAPATLRIAASAGMPVIPAPGVGEWTTPTGAALLATLARFEPLALTPRRIGFGAGTRDAPIANVARLWLCDDHGTTDIARTDLVQLETNLDDMNPEWIPVAIERLFEVGALDVWTTPILMKKSRPATLLSILAKSADEVAVARAVLEHTTSLGVRVVPIRRHEADRQLRTVETSYGMVRVKDMLLDGEVVRSAPEHDDCAAAAREHGVPIARVVEAASAAARAES